MLNYEYPPVGGGAGNATYYFLREASKIESLEIDLITSSQDENLYKEQIYPRITIHRLPIGKTKNNLNFGSNKDLVRYSKEALPYALKLNKNRNFDLIHAFFSVPCGFLALIIKILTKIPYIVSLRGADVPGYKKRYKNLDKYIFSWLNRIFIWKFAKHVVSNSAALKELALKTSINQEIKVIPNGIDIDFYKPNSQKQFEVLRINTGWTRLENRKAIDLLIHAFAKLKSDFSNLRLDIPGTGKELNNLKLLVTKLKLNKNVTFYEIASNDPNNRSQVSKILANSHILCLPSRNEGMSNAVLEGLACGLPVILTDVGGTAELLTDNKNGLIIKHDSIDDIYKKLRTLITDTAKIKQMGKESLLKSKQMSWKAVVEKYINQIYIVEKTNTAIKRRFDNEASIWSNNYKKANYNIIAKELVLRKKHLLEVVELIDKNKNIKVLEIGCGSGENIKEVIKLNKNWTGLGVDISDRMIGKARQTNRLDKQLIFKTLNFEQQQVEEKYDLILLMGVFGYFSNNTTVLDKLNEILSDQGILIFTVGNKKSLFRMIRSLVMKLLGKNSHFRAYNLKKFNNQVLKYFKIEKTINLCFSSGLLGPVSIGLHNLLKKIFAKNDLFNLALSKFYVCKKK
jgi:glycosyltransferase involved in cell wall biosynthesis/ubiquinone/menaquinone biosynthesis C-methylase UbiE